MDGCGAGEAPDASEFGNGDHPSTLLHVWQTNPDLKLPFLREAGVLAACGIPDQEPTGKIGSCYGRLQELSKGKDSVTGHWEMMGIVTEIPFPTYPNGFPVSLIQLFEDRIGRKVLGNKAASGTEIINELGAKHLTTGSPIVYTSADSVFQIACHESIIPIEDLYNFCLIARDICQIPNNVQRVIARPFTGEPENFYRTQNRRDFPVDPPPNYIDSYNEHFGPVYGLGVVPELFNSRGFMDIPRSRNNAEHGEHLIAALDSNRPFIFANFEDFDMLYGHRNNPIGFGKALVEFDAFLGNLWSQLTAADLLILTADHGNDPTTASTDHSREYVPISLLTKNGATTSTGDQLGFQLICEAIQSHLEH